jgi:hemerythrin
MSPDLATGIPEIDRQHGELLVQIAELGEAARTCDLPLAENVLAYLERYAATHFAINEHVLDEVARMARFLRGHAGVATSAP